MGDWDPNQAEAPTAASETPSSNSCRFDFHGKRWWEHQNRLVAKWNCCDAPSVYQRTLAQSPSAGTVVIVDGPPFSNGDIHVGHSLNKIAKDIIAKVHRMLGHRVIFHPGSDSHGLPIELRAQAELGVANPRDMDRTVLLQRCRQIVAESIAAQTASFRSLGVIADFPNQWSTADPAFEALVLRSFAQLLPSVTYERHLINWCPSCQTPLANSEVEPLVKPTEGSLVLFPLDATARSTLLASVFSFSCSDDAAVDNVAFIVWTTAPWSLRFSEALLISPSCEYCLVRIDEAPERRRRLFIVMGREVAKELCPTSATVLSTCSSSALAAAGISASNPIAAGRAVSIRVSHHVRPSKGTAVLHCAPSCGVEDYACLKEQCERVDLVDIFDESGGFLRSPDFPELSGLDIPAANLLYQQRLLAAGLLLTDARAAPFACIAQGDDALHSRVPSCWRCSGRVICRASSQYFLDTAGAIDALHAQAAKTAPVFLPPACRATFTAALRSRPKKWLLSRNRVWGVPIPAFVCDACSTAALSPDLALWLAERVERTATTGRDELHRDEEVLARFPSLSRCSACAAGPMRLETMTFDVFFESALSLGHTLRLNGIHNDDDVDALSSEQGGGVFLVEGPDQHRGFFGCTSLVSQLLADPVFRLPSTIVQHSFVVQEDGCKFSKSKAGQQPDNGLPMSLQKDVLRVSMLAGLKGKPEMRLSHDEMYRSYHQFKKIRGCLGQLANFLTRDLLQAAAAAAASDDLAASSLPLVERHVLSQLHSVSNIVLASLKKLDFAKAFALIADYTIGLRGAFFAQWFDQPPSFLLLSVLLHTLVRLLAPFYSFFAEELFEFLVDHALFSFRTLAVYETQEHQGQPPSSVHLCRFVRTVELLAPNEKKLVAQVVSIASRFANEVEAPPSQLRAVLSPNHPVAQALSVLEFQSPGVLAFLFSSHRRAYQASDLALCSSADCGGLCCEFSYPQKEPWLQFFTSSSV